MPLRLFDTARRQVRDFVPAQPGRVGIYLCGATVQAAPHVGHIRSGVNFDVLRRWLEATGNRVTFIRNVTDIDDKILAKAAAADEPWWAWAYRHEESFTRAYDVLGCLRPTYEPRATGHVPEMIELMRRLERSGHAYAPGNGDVYFDVSSFPAYGSLSGQRVDDLEPAADAAATHKRDPRDFALWKAARPDEPSWLTPWGAGRPGWHLECSAMAEKYLGPTFDIHGGGLDLVFPHHENEVAQSVAAGGGFARYWLHNAWVTTAGEKMSKSLGNSLLVDEVVKRVRPLELRFYLISAHYRSAIEFGFEALDETAVSFRRIEGFLHRVHDLVGGPISSRLDIAALPAGFTAAMDDDLAVPHALAVLHESLRAGNSALDARRDGEASERAGEVRAMLAVLGCDPLADGWLAPPRQTTAAQGALEALVSDQLARRQAARAARDYATSDRIRDRLASAGIAVEDTPTGPRWTLTEARVPMTAP